MKRLWTLVILAAAVSAHARVTNDLLAHYRFVTNTADSLGRGSAFVITNASFKLGGVFVDGHYPMNGIRTYELGTAPLKELNYESFAISLDFLPEPASPGHKYNKAENVLDSIIRGAYTRWRGYIDNGTSNILTGGQSYRWLGFNFNSGLLTFTMNNQAFTHTFSKATVTPRHWHSLICSVDLQQKQILTLFDGQKLEAINLPEGFKLSVTGSPDDAADREFTFANFSNGSTFRGHAANLKVFRRALTGPEMAGIYAAAASERPTGGPGQAFRLLILALLVVAVGVLFLLARRIWRMCPPKAAA